MCHIGILMACEHYPAIQNDPQRMDCQLRSWLAEIGHAPSHMTYFKTYLGELPATAGEADIWIVSGAPVTWDTAQGDARGDLMQFLKAAAACGRPIFGLYHGEHTIHKALADPIAPRPDTRAFPTSIRNPFNSFRQADALFAFSQLTRTVTALKRPERLTIKTMLSRRLSVA